MCEHQQKNTLFLVCRALLLLLEAALSGLLPFESLVNFVAPVLAI